MSFALEKFEVFSANIIGVHSWYLFSATKRSFSSYDV